MDLNEKIQRQKKLGQAQFQAMMDVYGHYREGTFMSLDIVGSTKLKEGVDSIAVVDSFKAFHGYVSAFITGSVSSVFSGDGVMCLFKTPQEAVDAGLAILRNLETFNRHKSRLKRYLNVRVGVNTGMILYEEKKELGKYTERTIDIAGHFQKYGEPGQLLVSRATWEKLSNQDEFKKRWWRIDKTTVYEYKKIYTPAVSTLPLLRILPSWDKVRYKIRRAMFLVLREWKYKIAFGGAAIMVLLLIYFNNFWNGDTFPMLKRDEAAIHGWVVNNKVWYARPWYQLSDAKIKVGETWQYLPKTVYLIVPQGKNSTHNMQLGIRENEIVTLKRTIGNRYCMAWGRTGIYLRYVETFNNYYVFMDKDTAEEFLSQIK